MTTETAMDKWQQVAGLKPRLHSHVNIEQRHYRGKLWYVLQNQSTSEHFRFGPSAYRVISRLQGELSLAQIAGDLDTDAGDDLQVKAELIQLITQLLSRDLVQFDVAPNYSDIEQRQRKKRSDSTRRTLMMPLSPRFPLIDPERFLTRAMPYIQPLFTRTAFVAWALTVITALLLAGSHWRELGTDIAQSAVMPHNLVLLWLTFPVLKVLHELGHAFATKARGGEVHSMGFGLLVLMPVPFVDASAASSFPSKTHRIIVGAAGMVVELFIAALALFLWLVVEPGLVRDLCCVVMFIAGLSTVIFNANPLLKFDGYHMLTDAFELPNLAGRATKYYGYLIKRYGFGLENAESPASSAGERRWFAIYGLAAFCYRIVIAAAIILFIAGKFFVVGVVLAIWVSITMLVLPAIKSVQYLLTSPLIAERRPRAIATSSLVLASTLSAIFLVPVNSWTRTEGVIWMPEHAEVRAGVDGNLKELLAQPGQLVTLDQPLVRSEDPFLSIQVDIIESRVEELKARMYEAQEEDRVQASIISEQLSSAKAELGQARQRASRLTVTSPSSGTFIAAQSQDLPGRFVKQGQLLGYVADISNTPIRVAIEQAEVGLVRSATRSVQVRFNSEPLAPVNAAIAREIPAAASRLPSKVLGSAGGGEFRVNPADETGLETAQQLFQFELQLTDAFPPAYFGERVQVRFDHGRETLAKQWFRVGRRLFLSSFGV